MKLEKGYIYHVYNQGNNKRPIFYTRRNYFFFMKKIRTHIIPRADIIAWCLMPNHFHLMLYIKNEFIEIEGGNRRRSMNHSIGILLRSYARAINKQEETTGSLFRQDTKSKCVNCNEDFPNHITLHNSSTIHLKESTEQYPQVCFDYIHQNPLTSGLVTKKQDWEFSSAREYVNNEEILVCYKRAFEFIDFKASFGL